MKIITVAALKGGVGKTNFVFNLSTMLSLKNHKVLVVDLDPQGNLSKTFKLSKKEANSKKLFTQNIDLLNEKIIEKWEHEQLNIDVIPTNIAMTTLEDELHTRTAREAILKRTFIKNINLLKQYDYIIFDTNPSINIVNKNALVIADEIIVISDNSIYSLEAVNMLSNNWELICQDLGIKNNINTIVLNNFDHYRISKDFAEYITNSKFKNKILKTQIKRKQKFKKSEITGIPSILLEKTENHTYYHVYQELIERGVL